MPPLKVSPQRLMGKQDCGTGREGGPVRGKDKRSPAEDTGAEVMPMGPRLYFHLVSLPTYNRAGPSDNEICGEDAGGSEAGS